MQLGISYFGNRITKHYQRYDLPEIVDLGCDYVLHTYSENDFEFYEETIGELVNLSHQVGLQVYLDPWGIGGVFGGEAYSNFLIQHRDAWQIDQYGNFQPRACLRNPEFMSYMRTWIASAVKLGADCVFWDEPKLTLPSFTNVQESSSCYCKQCKNDFEEKYSYPIYAAPADQIQTFQEESLINFIGFMSQEVKSRGLKNAICFAPPTLSSSTPAIWHEIAAAPAIDILGVTPYWGLVEEDPFTYVTKWSNEIVELSTQHGKTAQVWLQGFGFKRGKEIEIRLAGKAIEQSKVESVAIWGYKGCHHMSKLRSIDSIKSWDMLKEVMSNLARKKP